MFLRIVLLVLGLQKAIDALSLHPPIAEAVLKLLGLDVLTVEDPLHFLLARLWGCASLAWAYFLLRAAKDPQGNKTTIEGSILGFVTAGLVAVLNPLPLVRIVGIWFFIEAALLLIGRSRVK